MILLDTNVVSEIMRTTPDPAVSRWLDQQPDNTLWTGAVVLAELFAGIDSMPSGRKQASLRQAVELMIAEDFQGQFLSFDLDAARVYGKILAERKRLGRPISVVDAQIAAIASVHNAALATRNTSDFEHCGIHLINPWNAR